MISLQAVVSPVPFWLVHGTKDPLMGAQQARDFAAALESRGWPVHLDEIPTDQAGVIMAEYDPGPGPCRPATADRTIRTGRRAARVLSPAATGRNSISNP
jgi:hypothetical protein